MIEVSTPNFGLQFIQIAKEYVKQTKVKNKLNQAVKIIIFTASAIEAISNMEAIKFFSGKDLEDFIRNGPKSDNRKISATIKKWDHIFTKLGVAEKDYHLNNLSALIDLRNELIHFKPHKNITEKTLADKKKQIKGPRGMLFTVSRKTGYQISKKGVLNELTLTKARNHFKEMDELIFAFYSKKRVWPYPTFSNAFWGTKSPFWKYRKKYE